MYQVQVLPQAARLVARHGVLRGAAGRQGIELVGTNVPTELFGLCAIGIIASASVGYVTVKYFIRYLENHSLDGFAAYRFGLAGCIFFLLID